MCHDDRTRGTTWFLYLWQISQIFRESEYFFPEYLHTSHSMQISWKPPPPSQKVEHNAYLHVWMYIYFIWCRCPWSRKFVENVMKSAQKNMLTFFWILTFCCHFFKRDARYINLKMEKGDCKRENIDSFDKEWWMDL